jgi:hypothetical protein
MSISLTFSLVGVWSSFDPADSANENPCSDRRGEGEIIQSYIGSAEMIGKSSGIHLPGR